MNSNGELINQYFGDGSLNSPSGAFWDEKNTGIYLDTPGPSSGFTFGKRGVKRLRLDDTGSTFYGPVNIGTESITSISLSDGSASAPSLSFSSTPNSGLYHLSSPENVFVGINGTPKQLWTTDHSTINTNLTVNGQINEGTNPLFSGDITCGSIDTKGNSISCGTFTAGSMSGGDTTVNDLTCSSLTSNLSVVSPYVSAGTTGSPGPFYTFITDPSFSAGLDFNANSGGTTSELLVQSDPTSYIGIGNGSMTMSLPIQAPVGSASEPSFSFTTATDMGIHTGTSGAIAFDVKGSTIASVGTSALTSTVPFHDLNMSTGSYVVTNTSGLMTTTSASPLTNSIFFGDGSDGAVTYSDGATHTLTKNMYYTTLTITNGSFVVTAGYRIYCSVALTGDGTGFIQFNGNSGSGQAGGTLVATLQIMRPGGSNGGGTGGNVSTNGANAAGSAPGGVGGVGGVSDVKTGGTSTVIADYSLVGHLLWAMQGINITLPGGIGGGGGAGGSTQPGGGGGASGGLIFIFAKSIGGVSIQAIGGNGANATLPGGGGGGGGGGYIYVVYNTLTGGWGSGNCTVAGGNGGTGFASGTNGSAGTIYLQQI